MMSPMATFNYIEIMKESLFTSVGLSQILNFSPLQKRSVELLHQMKVTPTPPEIVQSYFAVLEMKKNTQAEDSVWNALPHDMSRLTLKELRQIVMAQFIAWKLNCDPAEVHLVFPKYLRISHRCLNWIKQSLEILMEETTLEKDKILRHGYLLQANPKNTADVLRNIESLSGIPMEKLLHKRPKILMSSRKTLLEVESLFTQHGIPPDSLLRHPELYTLSANTLRERLEEFDSIPEFSVLKNHPRVSRLIYYQKKAKARVEYFRSINMTGASLHLLSLDKNKFKRQLEKGGPRTRGLDILTYLKTYFSKTKKEIRQAIHMQPHWLNSSSINMKDSLQFIEEFKVFTKSQIFSALPIILYPRENLQQKFQAVLDSKEASLTDDYFLHMVLYFLEKSVHFSGDGLWHRNSTQLNTDDEGDDEHVTRFDSYLDNLDNMKKNKKRKTAKLLPEVEETEPEEIVFGESLYETLNNDNNNKKKPNGKV
ncbi:transcription termination factor 5, mitochondrial isoform X2 [Folsomia candida]|nr:transcription termination factor 5, mitochondrial isoform X2 [Folsomia candida]XP_035709832.1 transcription termination factor 5, mitochondrial isoform X2 [Folsomia candida]